MFDSLMTLCENALGRRVIVGDKAETLSDDEHLLVGMLDGSKLRRSCIDCPERAATSLDCAICSTRIMMSIAMVQRSGRLVRAQIGLTAASGDSGTLQ